MFKCEALERKKQTLLYYAILYYSSYYSTIVAKDREEDNAFLENAAPGDDCCLGQGLPLVMVGMTGQHHWWVITHQWPYSMLHTVCYSIVHYRRPVRSRASPLNIVVAQCSLLEGEQSDAWRILLRNDRKSRHRRIQKATSGYEAWACPQASYPCGNFSDTSFFKLPK